jgi:hypothetical protein
MFFTYHQNNSGGVMVQDNTVAEYVIIEAPIAYMANKKALEVGIYFGGVNRGIDCGCCGDRWYPCTSEDGKDAPEIYGDTLLTMTRRGDKFKAVIHKEDGSTIYISRNGSADV